MHAHAVFRLVLAGALAGCMVGCGTTTRIVVARGGPTPAWVDKLPRKAGEFCAVGYSGPTFYQQDCVKNAAENARSHLAESISITIRSVTIDISDGTRGYFDKNVFVEGSESASTAVLQGSEIQSQWVDLQGQRGAQNGCYALVCIDPSKPIDKFVEKLKEKQLPKKTVETVRENAEAAFEELEKLEEKKALEKSVPEQPAAEQAPDQDPADAGQDGEAPDQDSQPAAEVGPTPAVRKIEIPAD